MGSFARVRSPLEPESETGRSASGHMGVTLPDNRILLLEGIGYGVGRPAHRGLFTRWSRRVSSPGEGRLATTCETRATVSKQTVISSRCSKACQASRNDSVVCCRDTGESPSLTPFSQTAAGPTSRAVDIGRTAPEARRKHLHLRKDVTVDRQHRRLSRACYVAAAIPTATTLAVCPTRGVFEAATVGAQHILASRPPWELILFKERQQKGERRCATAFWRQRGSSDGAPRPPFSFLFCALLFSGALRAAAPKRRMRARGVMPAWPFSGGLETAGEHWLSFPLPAPGE